VTIGSPRASKPEARACGVIDKVDGHQAPSDRGGPRQLAAEFHWLRSAIVPGEFQDKSRFTSALPWAK
jgi:hypothetical protein